MDLWGHSELSIRWNFSLEVIEKAIQRHRDSAGGIFKILLKIKIFLKSPHQLITVQTFLSVPKPK
jgi:hypothetical protein